MTRKYFMINHHERYVAELGLKHLTPGSTVRHTADRATEPCLRLVIVPHFLGNFIYIFNDITDEKYVFYNIYFHILKSQANI